MNRHAEASRNEPLAEEWRGRRARPLEVLRVSRWRRRDVPWCESEKRLLRGRSSPRIRVDGRRDDFVEAFRVPEHEEKGDDAPMASPGAEAAAPSVAAESTNTTRLARGLGLASPAAALVAVPSPARLTAGLSLIHI